MATCRRVFGRPLTVCMQHMVYELAEKLHGDILEGKGRPMKELQNEQIIPDLN